MDNEIQKIEREKKVQVMLRRIPVAKVPVGIAWSGTSGVPRQTRSAERFLSS